MLLADLDEQRKVWEVSVHAQTAYVKDTLGAAIARKVEVRAKIIAASQIRVKHIKAKQN